MRRECREHFPRHRFQRKPLVSDPGMHHDTCVTHVPWCMLGLLTRRSGENVSGIPGVCATRNFTYLIRGPWPSGIMPRWVSVVVSDGLVPIWYHNICNETAELHGLVESRSDPGRDVVAGFIFHLVRPKTRKTQHPFTSTYAGTLKLKMIQPDCNSLRWIAATPKYCNLFIWNNCQSECKYFTYFKSFRDSGKFPGYSESPLAISLDIRPMSISS